MTQNGTETRALAKSNAPAVLAELDVMRPQLAQGMPAFLTVDRLMRVVRNAVQINPYLLQCDRRSLCLAVLSCAQLGLEPDGVMASLVPFGGKVTLIPGYRGYVHIARQSGEMSGNAIEAHVVFAGDDFDYGYGLDPWLKHKPKATKRTYAEVTEAYAVARFKDGSRLFEVMTKEQIDRIRQNVLAGKKNADKSPWHDVYTATEMARKSPVRRIAKYLPRPVQLLAMLDDAADAERSAHVEGGAVLYEPEAPEPVVRAGSTAKLDALAADGREPGDDGDAMDLLDDVAREDAKGAK